MRLGAVSVNGPWPGGAGNSDHERIAVLDPAQGRVGDALCRGISALHPRGAPEGRVAPNQDRPRRPRQLGRC